MYTFEILRDVRFAPMVSSKIISLHSSATLTNSKSGRMTIEKKINCGMNVVSHDDIFVNHEFCLVRYDIILESDTHTIL